MVTANRSVPDSELGTKEHYTEREEGRGKEET
jgi:hypothetical protein